MKPTKKKWTIFFNCPKKKRIDHIDIFSSESLLAVLTNFGYNYNIDTIISIHSEEVKTDSLIEFLDNNPPQQKNTPAIEEMTEEQKLYYNYGFHDSETANFKQQMIDLGEWK